MKTEKRKKFADKGKAILQKPSGIGDFLNDDESETTNEPKAVKTKEKKITLSNEKKREEFKFPVELSEKLRKYSFDKRLTKTSIVIRALELLFETEGY